MRMQMRCVIFRVYSFFILATEHTENTEDKEPKYQFSVISVASVAEKE